MKNLNILRILMIVASGFLFIQCTSDLEIPDPIPGPAGTNGLDGLDGLDGVDGTASCVSCHSNATREPLLASWEVALHNTGFVSFAAGRADCAQCHSEEGYVDYLTLGAVDTAGYATPSRFNCTTCHDRHSTFDFENDGLDYALRNIDPVTLVIDNATVIDFGDASNNCITCHQPRDSYPVPGGTDSVTVTSSRYGPHHGPQATMLEGIMAANIPGAVAYPPVASATHRTESSCVACHMGESTDVNEGLHSWNPTEESCIACHPTGAPDEMAEFTADFTTLQNLLIAEGALTAAGDAVPGTYSAEVGQALWNWRTLLEDKSNGIHNPGYTRALLKNSIEALQ
jgi:hypothetical protein